jgi:hypothetical protein
LRYEEGFLRINVFGPHEGSKLLALVLTGLSENALLPGERWIAEARAVDRQLHGRVCHVVVAQRERGNLKACSSNPKDDRFQTVCERHCRVAGRLKQKAEEVIINGQANI